MDKIHYLPTEGTTGFWGLRDWPNPDFLKFRSGIEKHGALKEYNAALESCKSNKLEIIGHIPGIVSGCEVGLMFLENGGAKLKPGDLFDLPEGYEFKEEEKDGNKVFRLHKIQ